MPAYIIRINGVAVDFNDHPVERLKIAEVMNGINRLDLEVAFDDAFRASVVEGMEIEVEEDSVLAYGGYIDEVREKTINWTDANLLQVTSTDFSAITQFRSVNLTLAAGTLKDQLLQLEDPYLTDYGAAIDAGQVDGPAMPETPIVDLYLRDILNLLSKNAPGYAWTMSYDKKLSMAATATNAAPFSLATGDGKVLGDMKVQRKRNERYANRVIVRSPPVTRLEYDETFVADGVEDTFVLTGQAIRTYGYVTNGIPEYETMAFYPETDATWQFNASTNSVTRLAGAPTAGTNVIVKYDGIFTAEAMAEDVGEQAPPTGIREITILAEAGLSQEAIQAWADGELAARLQPFVRVLYKTQETGIHPGQTQEIEESHHDIDGDFLITEVEIVDERLGGQLTRNVSGNESTRFPGTFRDTYTLFAKVGAGGGGAAPEGVSDLGPCPPEGANQFFDAGKFGGKSTWKFYKDQNSIHSGDLSSIDAANFESCQAFGYDCHIADP